MKRLLNVLLALIFALFAFLNLNDEDAVVWVAAYGSVAVLFGLAVFGRADRRISALLGLGLSIWMLTMSPDMMHWIDADMPSITEEMNASAPHIEAVREFLGLALAVFALIFLTFSTPKEARIG